VIVATFNVTIEDVDANVIVSESYDTESEARIAAGKATRNPAYAGYKIWLTYPSGMAVQLNPD
jgi:hypothetical protein